MNFKQLTLAAAALVFTAVANATPVYTGETTSTGALVPDRATEGDQSGFYIWNEETSPLDWHVRWTNDQDPDSSARVDWFGSILFMNSNLEEAAAVRFENNDDLYIFEDAFFLAGMDAIAFDAVTNSAGGVDGIDFSLTEGTEILSFSLGTSLYEADQVCISCDSSYIFIGEGLYQPDVLVSNTPLGTLQSFEVSVPEPSIITLFGLGIIGMGIASRRRKS